MGDVKQAPLKRINITVQPVDNGYTVGANVSDHPHGRNARMSNLIAKDAAEVKEMLAIFLEEAFAEVATTGAVVS